jgi:hypothetical protein
MIDLTPLPNQAAGHAESIFIGPRRGVVYKPVTSGEAAFYERTSGDERWRAFLPRFVGVEQRSLGITRSSELSQILLLEDVTDGYRHACVMDVKIGYSTAAEDAAEHKRIEAQLKDRDTTTHSLALRICGLRVFDGTTYQCRDKSWGKALTDDGFFDGLRFFFDPRGDGSPTVRRRRRATLVSIVEQLERLATFMEQQRDFRFYASSLLFVYDAILEHSSNDDDETADERAPRIAMIDMAHVFAYRNDSVGDNGYSVAIQNLLRYFRRLIDESDH